MTRKAKAPKKSGGRKFKVPTQNEILKKYGSSLQFKASTINHHGLWIPSTFFALNYQMGGGVPFGKIIEIMGEESSGKSLIAYNFAYATQQLGGHVIWVDAEQAWMNSWAEENGLDPERVTVLNDTRIETISDAIADLAIYWRSKLVNNEPIIVVIDSIAALDSIEAIDAKMADGKAEMGNRAKQRRSRWRCTATRPAAASRAGRRPFRRSCRAWPMRFHRRRACRCRRGGPWRTPSAGRRC